MHDNWRLSHQRVITPEQWKALGWQGFQRLVYDYLCERFGEAAAIVQTATGGPDGGRDLELTFTNPARNWKAYVECKSHNAKLGLAVLGKYLVVVIINYAQELFIVSSSAITDSACAQFIQVAESSRIHLSLIHGRFLDDELRQYPSILAKYFPTLTPSKRELDTQPLQAAVYVRPFPEVDIGGAVTHRQIKLHTTHFYIHILLKNLAAENLEINDIAIPNASYSLFVTPLSEYGTPRKVLSPLQDASVVYSCRVQVPRPRFSLGEIVIGYRVARVDHKVRLDLPSLDFSGLTTPPLIGETLQGFLNEDLHSLSEEVVLGEARLLDVRGISGVGKSRLMDEVSARLREAHFVVLRYDAIFARDSLFRRLIADLAALPIYKGGLTHATRQVIDLLVARGCALEYATDIAKFLVSEDITLAKFYAVSEVLKHFLGHPARDAPISVVIDNVQELSPKALQLLLVLAHFLQESPARILLVLATNTEIMPRPIVTPLTEFHERLDAFGQGYFRTRLDLEPLTHSNARLLIYSLLELAPADPTERIDDAVIDMLLQKAGTRPLDLMMAIHWFEETGVIRRSGSLTWFIPDFRHFAQSVRFVPRGSAALIRRRLLAIGHLVTPSRQRSLKSILQFLVAFSGSIPSVFAERRLDRSCIELLLERSILRQELTYSGECLVAFHDNIFRFLISSPTWSSRAQHARSILDWLAKQDEVTQDELALVELANAVRARRPASKVIDIAERAINRSHGRTSSDIREVGEQLEAYFNRCRLTLLDLRRYLPIKLRYANALVHEAQVSEGLRVFEDLYHYVKSGSMINTADGDRFYHQFVNAHLHTARYDRALEILHEMTHHHFTSDEYLFLLYDRYGVAHTALGHDTEATTWLDRALGVALAAGNQEWMSICYYDIAYVHLHVTFNIALISDALRNSIVAHDRASEKPSWRRIETHQAMAISALLKGHPEVAAREVEQGLWLSKRESTIIYDAKLLNLLGVCHLILGQLGEARHAFEGGRSKAAMSFNSRAYWRAIANLGALTAIEDGPRSGLDFFVEVERHLLETPGSAHAFARELPIIANYIALCAEIADRAKIKKLLEMWDERRLHRFARTVLEGVPRSKRNVPGVIQYGGFAFLVT
jgi:tetratricopeptide (TPR) repeat protein